YARRPRGGNLLLGGGLLFSPLRRAAIRPQLALVRAGLALVGAQLLFISLQLRAVALDLVVLRERRAAERDQCPDGDECAVGLHLVLVRLDLLLVGLDRVLRRLGQRGAGERDEGGKGQDMKLHLDASYESWYCSLL